MDKLTEKAYAKINLSLDMLSKRADGYHRLLSFMQKISLCDEVSVEIAESGINISSDSNEVPLDESNICHKAAKAYLEAAQLSCGVNIHIEKHIPVAAGLAGGSTDGAKTLELMKKLFKKNVDISKIAKKLGADVNFCLLGSSCVCSGIGEQLEEIYFPNKEKYLIVIAKGQSSLSTKTVYSLFDEKGIYKTSPDTERLVSAIKKGESFAEYLSNDFEDIVCKMVPDIENIKKIMADNSALNSLMSGSGPSVYGIFDNEAFAEKTKLELREKGYFAEKAYFI